MDTSKAKNVKVSRVRETDYGTYVWKMPDGTYVGDGDGHLLCILSKENDISRMVKLQRAVRYYGIKEGEPHYMPDRQPVTDGEHDSMMERYMDGKVPDPASPGSIEGNV